MLLGSNMIEMKRSRVVGLWQQTILAALPCPLPHQLTQRSHHLTVGRLDEFALAPVWLSPVGFQ